MNAANFRYIDQKGSHYVTDMVRYVRGRCDYPKQGQWLIAARELSNPQVLVNHPHNLQLRYTPSQSLTEFLPPEQYSVLPKEQPSLQETLSACRRNEPTTRQSQEMITIPLEAASLELWILFLLKEQFRFAVKLVSGHNGFADR